MTFWRGLRSAAIQDGVSYAWGLAIPALYLAGIPIAIPFSTLFWAGGALRNAAQIKTVDWDLRDWKSTYFRELQNVLDIQYRTVRYNLPQILLHENPAGKDINSYQLLFDVQAKPFALSPQTRAITEKGFEAVMDRLRKKSTYYEETHIRLLDIQEVQSGLRLTVQPVSFADYLRTNLLLDYRQGDQPTLRELVHPDGSLEPLSSSGLANSMGINVLVFTASGCLVLQKRSRKVGIRPGEYAPSGSGGMTIADAISAGSAGVKPITIIREVTEEIGINVDSKIESTLTYMGITRELIRGGMPEIFFCAQSDFTERDILQACKRARDRHEFAKVRIFPLGKFATRALHTFDDAQSLSSEVDRLLDRIWNEASIPLLTALALWVRQKRITLLNHARFAT